MKPIDDIDIEIIKILQADARTPYRIITKKIGISIGTIHNRITKLMKMGIILKNTILINEHKLGYTITSIFNLIIESSKIQQTLTELSLNTHICSLFQITGRFSASAIAKFKDTEELHLFIKKLNNNPFITSLQTEIVLDQIKFFPNLTFNGEFNK
jgi:Lrp/AsnC family transcriptional regulator for asnA, asnC and gidA